MKPAIALALRAVSVTAAVILLTAASTCPDYTGSTEPPASSCAPGTFKCESPTIPGGVGCFKSSYTTDWLYVCVQPDGSPANYAHPSLEDLSDYTNRNNITCVSKVRCTRQ